MINPVKTVVKCCGCIVLSQLIGILVSLGILAAFILLFYLYVIPWGEDQIRNALHLGSDVDIGSLSPSVVAANSCSGCVFGVNTDWPTNTTGTLHFLDTSAGPLASGVIATSLAGGAVAGVASMLWASFFPSAASVMSFSSGFYEMTHIIEQAQFISMISQLQIDGAPVFLHAFSREMAWTNFNVPKSITDLVKSTSRRQRRLSSLLSTTASGETGPKRYAALIGVDPKNLFFYTLLCFAIVFAAIHVLYIIGVVIFSMLSKKESFGQVAAKLYRKVIWACILALLLAQYIFSMSGSFYIYQNAGSSDDRDKYYVWGTIGLIIMVGFAILFGVLIISKNKKELEDIGTIAHDQRPFSAKYGAYYDEYNFDNRFFFVPRILLAVSTGAVVGVIQDSTTQLLCILGITVLYLVLLLAREPNLLRFLYYIGITSVFMKVVLVCMMLMLVQDDYFPQEIRDNVAYGIIGVNMFIFFLLFLRQAYTIIHKLVRGCKNKNKARSSSADEVINLENGNNNPTSTRNNPPYARMESTPYDNNKVDRSFNSNSNAMASQQQQFAGGAQRSPYERAPSEAGLAAIGGAGNARNVQDSRSNAPNEWGQYDARQGQQQQQQYQNQNAGAAAAGVAAVGAAAAARDRNSYGQQNNNSKYQNGSSARDRTSFGANQRVADPMDRYSTASASPTPYQALNSTSQFNNNMRSPNPVLVPPPRKLSVDVDDMDDDDIVAEPSAIKQTNSAPQSQQASSSTAGNNPGNPLRVRQSYLRFTDSDMSYDDDIDGRSPRNSMAAGAAVGAAVAGAQRGPPTSSSSQFSDFSTESTATDWFDRRSKTEIETDASFISAADPNDTVAVTVAAGAGRPSAFGGERDSMDSYGTTSEIGSTNRSLMTADSTTGAAFTSSNFDLNDRAIDTSGLVFEDDDDDDEEYELTDKQPTSDGIDTTGLMFEDASDGEDDRDVDIDEQVSFASSTSGVDRSDSSNDSYATQQGTVITDRSQLTVNSNSTVATSSTANPSYSPPTAYLRDTVVSGAQSENDYDNEYGSERDSYNPHESDSFISALSARSDEDARSFYIEGQRRNTAGGSPGEVAPTEDERQQQRPMKKL